MAGSRPAIHNDPEQPGSRLAPKLVVSAGESQVPEPICDDDPYVRLPPGEYEAACVEVKVYRDPRFRRWVARLTFRIFPENDFVCAFLNLGSGENQKVGRDSEYRRAWIVANGSQPSKRQVMSARVFKNKVFRVRVDDVTRRSDGREHLAAEVYSVVKEILTKVHE
jgi:hypothetical protein